MAIRTMFDKVAPKDLTATVLAALEICKTIGDYNQVYADAYRLCSFRMHSLQPGETAQTHEAGKTKAGDTLVELENYDRQHRPPLTKQFLAEYGVAADKARQDVQRLSLQAAKIAAKLLVATEKIIVVQKEVVELSPMVEQVCLGGRYQSPPLYKSYQTPWGPLAFGSVNEQSAQVAKTLVSRASLDLDPDKMLLKE